MPALMSANDPALRWCLPVISKYFVLPLTVSLTSLPSRVRIVITLPLTLSTFPATCAPDVNALCVEFAVALLEANTDVAVDFDLRPARLLIATLDHHGGIGPPERLAARLRVLDGQLRGADRGDRPAEYILRRRPLRFGRACRRCPRCRHGAGGECACQNARRHDSCEYLADHFCATSC